MERLDRHNEKRRRCQKAHGEEAAHGVAGGVANAERRQAGVSPVGRRIHVQIAASPAVSNSAPLVKKVIACISCPGTNGAAARQATAPAAAPTAMRTLQRRL